ncbi:MAG: hypothetical protein AAGE96_08795 [Cyanobacteria bacterium P01_G01_bin.19]
MNKIPLLLCGITLISVILTTNSQKRSKKSIAIAAEKGTLTLVWVTLVKDAVRLIINKQVNNYQLNC